jgi:hypothetical protein
MKWNAWTVYWLVIWFGLGFGIPETIALVTGHPENTLSDQVWRLEGLTASNSGTFWNPLTWSIPHFLIACGVIWLSFHFIDHIWR